MEGHVVGDNYFLVDFARVLPPDVPTDTKGCLLFRQVESNRIENQLTISHRSPSCD